MANLDGFNANDVDPKLPFDPVPNGVYTSAITSSANKPNSKGTGNYLEIAHQIIEGEYKGRVIWDHLNLDHPSDLAVKIARATLSQICRAVDVMKPQDSSALHDRPMRIKVVCKPRKDNGELANSIVEYIKIGSDSAPETKTVDSPPWA